MKWFHGHDRWLGVLAIVMVVAFFLFAILSASPATAALGSAVMGASFYSIPIFVFLHLRRARAFRQEYEARRAEERKPRVRRGALIGKHDRTAVDGDISIGGVPMPREIEPQHLLLEGSTGTGKSLAMHSLASSVRDRETDRAIVVDPGGEMMSRLWRAGDVILNPLDSRSVGWSPFAEITAEHDVDRVSKSMVPDIDGGDQAAQQWQLYSQNLVSAVLLRAWQSGRSTNGELVRLLTVASEDELRAIAEGTAAISLFADGAERMLGCVRAVIGSCLPAYRFLPPAAGPGAFSIRQWVEAGTGWLWLPVRTDMLPALRPLIAAWLGETVSAALTLRPDRERRLWLLLDELSSLGRVQSLSLALTQGRKFGLCCVGGLQTVAQLRGEYGQHGAQTLLSCFSSQLILRSGDPETADWCSRLLGEQQLSRRVQSEGTGGGGSHSGESEQITIERAVLPSEIAGLRDRHGYLRLAGDYPIARVEIPIPPEGDEVCTPFMPATPLSTAQPVTATSNDGSAPAPAPEPVAPAPLSREVQALVDQMLGK